MYKRFSLLVIQNSSGNLQPLFHKYLPTVISHKYSDSYFTQIFQQLFHKNLPTVISHKYSDLIPVVDSQLFWFTYIVLALTSNQAHVNFGKFGAKKLKLLLVAARRDELSVRLV